MRKTLRASILAAAATFAMTLSAVLTTAAPASAAQSVPAQGIFESCSLDSSLSTCEQRLQVMHNAGLSVVVTSLLGTQSLDNIQAYAQYAHSIGMSVMWELNDPAFWGGSSVFGQVQYDFPAFGSACGCTGTNALLTYMIKSLASLPGTYGYYAADDESITSSQNSALTQYVNEIKSIDPSSMVMIGSAPNQSNSVASTGATIGKEVYPVTTDSLLPMSQHPFDWEGVQQEVQSAQKAADNNGTASAFILQAFTFGDNIWDGQAVGACGPNTSQQTCYNRLRYPSGNEQLTLRNQVLKHSNAKLILWFNFAESYGAPAGQTPSYMTYPTGSTASSRWAGLSSAIGAPFPGAIAHSAKAKHRRGHHRHGHHRKGHHRKGHHRHGHHRHGHHRKGHHRHGHHRKGHHRHGHHRRGHHRQRHHSVQA